MDLGNLGVSAAIAFAAIGSALGAGAAGQAAIGAWKKCFATNKPAPFLLAAFVGAPLTQIFYGMVLMNTLADAQGSWLNLGIGVFGGIAMGFSALLQGKAGAAASDAFAETGQGFVNYLMVLGIIETVALFVMVFLMGKVV